MGSLALANPPPLGEFDPSKAKIIGRQLMALEHGLHRLDKSAGDEPSTLVIGVHGYASRGLEWVYPLATLDSENTSTYFFRWDFKGCADNGAQVLLSEIKELSGTREIDLIKIFGHSYGGVLAAILAGKWPLDMSVEIHTIAAPLSRIGRRASRCNYKAPGSLKSNVTLRQWRTIHELDGAFKGLARDPQIVEIPGSSSIRLPETYRGRRLGHNWSISWVADNLMVRGSDYGEHKKRSH